MDVKLGMLCITLAKLWQSDRDGLKGVFLQPIARLLAIKTTRQTARVRLITDRRELCRASLTASMPVSFSAVRQRIELPANAIMDRPVRAVTLTIGIGFCDCCWVSVYVVYVGLK